MVKHAAEKNEKHGGAAGTVGMCLLLVCLVCGCAQTETRKTEADQAASSEESEREYVTEEEIYQKALGLLCYGEGDYRGNAAAKQLLELIRGYKDSEDYLDQIYLVCTHIVTGRIDTEFLYDANGHVQFEKGNPYYGNTEEDTENSGILYGYEDGLITQEVYPNGDIVRYQYDEDGRIVKMEDQRTEGKQITYTYEYELDENGRISKRTGYIDGIMAGEQTSEYRTDPEGKLTVIQHETVPQRNPSEKMRLLLFDKEGKLVRVENEEESTRYSYQYVWLPEYDPREEFVYEHRIRMAYF